MDRDEHEHERAPGAKGDSRFWTRWITAAFRQDRHPGAYGSTDEASEVDVQVALTLLPERLCGSGLPDGVVELVVEDLEAPARRLFDVRNGDVTVLEPGAAVPWASISGPASAWAVALGPDCDVAGLKSTGDEHLARRVLAAFPARSEQG